VSVVLALPLFAFALAFAFTYDRCLLAVTLAGFVVTVVEIVFEAVFELTL
jgi:hypothetical protein